MLLCLLKMKIQQRMMIMKMVLKVRTKKKIHRKTKVMDWFVSKKMMTMINMIMKKKTSQLKLKSLMYQPGTHEAERESAIAVVKNTVS